MKCNLCPRACNIDRTIQTGFCKTSENLKIARASLHHWEEPCISYKNGSGTIFFTGCSLGCVFCQNNEISHKNKGIEVSEEKLVQIFYSLKNQGAHNINLVTPSHFVKKLAPVLDKSPLPVVWNSSAFETVESLKLLENKVDIFLPDFKFSKNDVAKKYCNAENYPEIAKKAILEMFRQTGPYKINNGLMASGVIIRHLVLPQNLENTYSVIDWVASTFKKGDVLFSLMSQYTPYVDSPYPELNRTLTNKEYVLAKNYMIKKDLTDGFIQSLSSAKASFTPDFDLTGI
ncbi:MAG: 4Fe-4S cluster-binding domain-containing protein [Clostridiales bacterium]|nr:4Fe-4S cluster-binding domain-containing protein [Clostridiales bacterium]